MKVVIYTHDAFGLGNIRRMLSIAEHLQLSAEDVSVLLFSGSPMLHSFRLSEGIDYIKLPTITRTAQEEYQSRSLGLNLLDSVRMRSNIILSAVSDFEPDVILVDKKPLGLKGELKSTLQYLNECLPATRVFLVLRDILDEEKITHQYWKSKRYFYAIERYYERVLILGSQNVYDASDAYLFPQACREKVHYCGYLKKTHLHLKGAQWVRRKLDIEQDKIILVTTGGGSDGEQILKHFLQFWQHQTLGEGVHAVIVHGPELSAETQQTITTAAESCQQLTLMEFTPHLLSFMQAADVIVCMAGYNTLSEALSMDKHVICIPRVKPVKEQLIRAGRFSQLGLLHFIHPDEVTADKLSTAVSQLLNNDGLIAPSTVLQFDALNQVHEQLVAKKKACNAINTTPSLLSEKKTLKSLLAVQLHIFKTILSRVAVSMCLIRDSFKDAP